MDQLLHAFPQDICFFFCSQLSFPFARCGSRVRGPARAVTEPTPPPTDPFAADPFTTSPVREGASEGGPVQGSGTICSINIFLKDEVVRVFYGEHGMRPGPARTVGVKTAPPTDPFATDPFGASPALAGPSESCLGQGSDSFCLFLFSSAFAGSYASHFMSRGKTDSMVPQWFYSPPKK